MMNTLNTQNQKGRSDRPIETKMRPRDPHKPPPHSADSEAGALGCIMLAAEGHAASQSVSEMIELFHQADFHDLRNQQIFTVICELNRKGVSPVTLNIQARLKELGQLDSVGGLAY